MDNSNDDKAQANVGLLVEALDIHLKWFERFICNEDASNSSTPRKVAQNAQDAASELRAAIASLGAAAVPQFGPRPSYIKPRNFLLLASYCGGDTEGCTDGSPCPDCLAMCNIYGEDGEYVGTLPATPQPAADDYKGWYDAALTAANEAGYGPCSAADAIRMLAEDNAALRKALAPLIAIADAYDDNALDDEARKVWGTARVQFENTTPPAQIELYTGRGGKRLLTLADCFAARAVVKSEG